MESIRLRVADGSVMVVVPFAFYCGAFDCPAKIRNARVVDTRAGVQRNASEELSDRRHTK